MTIFKLYLLKINAYLISYVGFYFLTPKYSFEKNLSYLTG